MTTTLYGATHQSRPGPNWTFRVVAEVVSVACGTFIAASLAPGRERTAAIVGALAISVGFALKLWVTFFWSAESLQSEPWYQHATDAGVMVVAPLMGAFVAEAAGDLHRTSRGVGGISRFHLLWLWPVVFI